MPSYVGTVDTMVIAEGTEVPTSFPSWLQGYSANNFATLTYGVASPLPVTGNKASVAYQYVTHDGVYPDGNPWDEVSTELDTLLGLL